MPGQKKGKDNITIDRLIEQAVLGADSKLCFVIIPFRKPFNGVYAEIKRTAKSRGMKCLRVDEKFGQDVIMDTIIGGMKRAVIVIADITKYNPNVFYEVGFAHALKKKTLLLRAIDGDKVPFDLCHRHYIEYENVIGGGQALRRKLRAGIDEIMKDVTN